MMTSSLGGNGDGERGESRGIVKDRTTHFSRDVSKTTTVRENILHAFSLDKTRREAIGPKTRTPAGTYTKGVIAPRRYYCRSICYWIMRMHAHSHT